MRFLHTSDWHLGKTLHGHDLAEAQAIALETMIELAVERQVDAIVIAGDVYDRAFPSVDDVRRLNDAFTRIHQAGVAIVCTAGNHDEGARLGALSQLLDDRVTIVGEYNQVGSSFTLEDEFGPVAFYPLPYLHPDGARRDLAPADGPLLERSHEAVIGEAMRRVRADVAARRSADPSLRVVVVAHAFIVRGSESPEELLTEQCESERDIAVGGVPSAPTAVFDGTHYVALGHLHGARTVQEQDLVAERPAVRYSGSPLRYSLSEANHAKSVTIVDIDAEGACTIEEIPIPQPAGMVRLRGTLDEILSDAYAAHRGDFVELVITDSRPPDNWLAQLTHSFSRILKARHDYGVASGAASDEPVNAGTQVLTPLETLRNFYVSSRGEEPTPEMAQILQDVLERARQEADA